jgi:HD-like signal output (HDOD) protein
MNSPGIQIPLAEVVTTIADLHPMQVVGTRILEVTEGEQFSAHQLAQVISADQALTAKMLRVANSAYYSYPRRISTVRDAVIILGFRAVRSATLASCVMDTLTETTLLNGDDFWRFSVTVGTLSEARARATNTHQPDEAFTAGVIHNIGLLVVDQHLPHQLGEAMKFASSKQCSLEAAEREVLGFTDAELSSALLQHWNFPESLVEAVSDVSESVEIVPDGSLAEHRMGVPADRCGAPPPRRTRRRAQAYRRVPRGNAALAQDRPAKRARWLANQRKQRRFNLGNRHHALKLRHDGSRAIDDEDPRLSCERPLLHRRNSDKLTGARLR